MSTVHSVWHDFSFSELTIEIKMDIIFVFRDSIRREIKLRAKTKIDQNIGTKNAFLRI